MTIHDDDGALLLPVVAEVLTATDTALSRIETVLSLLQLAAGVAAGVDTEALASQHARAGKRRRGADELGSAVGPVDSGCD